ncbi:MAG: tyrosine-type recombinase/integrase, partial [Flavobacteriaceae bacterium]|nr:tyrosine-type recombinase/integrase [Flavobacteriaceae bacterium]
GHTRRAYAKAAVQFLDWCELQGMKLEEVDPVRAALYFRGLKKAYKVRTVKLHLSACKNLFGWFVTEGVIRGGNPLASIKGPKLSLTKGETPHLSKEEVKTLFDSLTGLGIKDYRDRAMLAILFYAWIRVNALVQMNVSDYQKTSDGFYTLKVVEKGSKHREIPAHHKVVTYVNAYLKAAQIDPQDEQQKTLPLFRTLSRTKQLSENRLDQPNLFRMIRARAKDANIRTDINNHTGRTTGITTYLESGGQREEAQRIAGHADPRTTQLYDRRDLRISQSEIEKVQY